MEFSKPESWSGQPFPSPGDLPNAGIKPRSPALQADSLPAEPREAHFSLGSSDKQLAEIQRRKGQLRSAAWTPSGLFSLRTSI